MYVGEYGIMHNEDHSFLPYSEVYTFSPTLSCMLVM